MVTYAAKKGNTGLTKVRIALKLSTKRFSHTQRKTTALNQGPRVLIGFLAFGMGLSSPLR